MSPAIAPIIWVFLEGSRATFRTRYSTWALSSKRSRMTIPLRLLHPPSVAGVALWAHTQSLKAIYSALAVYLALQGGEILNGAFFCTLHRNGFVFSGGARATGRTGKACRPWQCRRIERFEGGLGAERSAPGWREQCREADRQDGRLLWKSGHQDPDAQQPASAGKRAAGDRIRSQGRRVYPEHESLGGSRSTGCKKDFWRCHTGDDFRRREKDSFGGRYGGHRIFQEQDLRAAHCGISTVRRKNHEPKRSHAAIQSADGSIPVDSFCEKPEPGHQQARRCQGTRRIVLCISRSGTTNPERSRSSNHVSSERSVWQIVETLRG